MFIFCAGGCKSSVPELVSKNISEYRENYFAGKSGGVFASFTDGKREKIFVYDGVCSELVDFGVIVVKFDNYEEKTLPKFILYIDDEKFEGELERNYLDGTFVFDIEKVARKDSKVTLTIVQKNITLELENKSNFWNINCSKALDIFWKNSKTLPKHIKKGTLLGEIYIKLVADKQNQNIYYYILCVYNDSDNEGMLIDVNSGEIVQK